MSLKKGFLRNNKGYKSTYKQHNQRLLGLVFIMIIVLVGLLYFGYVK